MLSFILAFSLMAIDPQVVPKTDESNLSEETVVMEELLDRLDEEEIVFEDLTLSLEDDDENEFGVE